jgi:hypothetical protein
VPGKAVEQCVACADGEVCVQRTPEQLVCVSPGVCEALWDLGARDVCRYADKSGYDHTPLPTPEGPCPGGDASRSMICGGACGDCGQDFLRCTGRSPLHPFGVCARSNALSGFDPAEVKSCSLDDQGHATQGCKPLKFDAYCLVYDVPEADRTAARRWGVCIETMICTSIAQVLPGGARCYDDSGHQVAP